MILPRVISASRRMDMPACAPQKLAEILEKKCPPENVHTVVLWTKNAANILHHGDLNRILRRYDQIFVLYTITGMGGTVLEPGVPKPEDAMAVLPGLVQFTGHPHRVAVRFDPLQKFETRTGEILTNVPFFKELARTLNGLEMRTVFTSWVNMYPKVARRLARYGLRNIGFSAQERRLVCQRLLEQAVFYGLELDGCCISELPGRGCIQGALLNDLHPRGRITSVKRAKSQRPNCRCTESRDIGWYYTCAHGCVYCYGQPKIF